MKMDSKTFILICVLAFIPYTICVAIREPHYVASQKVIREIVNASLPQKLPLPSHLENAKQTRAATPETLSPKNDFGEAANVPRSRRIQRMALDDSVPGTSSGSDERQPESSSASRRPGFADRIRNALRRRPASSLPSLEEHRETSSSEESIYEVLPETRSDVEPPSEETYDRLQWSGENLKHSDSDGDGIYSKIDPVTPNENAPLIPPSLPLRNIKNKGGRRRFNVPGKKRLKQLSKSLQNLVYPYKHVGEGSRASSSFRGSVNSLPVRNSGVFNPRKSAFSRKVDQLRRTFQKLKPSYKRLSETSSGATSSSNWYVPLVDDGRSSSRRRSSSVGDIGQVRGSLEISDESDSDVDGIYTKPQPGTSRQSNEPEDPYEVPRPPPLPDRVLPSTSEKVERKSSLREKFSNSLHRRRMRMRYGDSWASAAILDKLKKEQDERDKE